MTHDDFQGNGTASMLRSKTKRMQGNNQGQNTVRLCPPRYKVTRRNGTISMAPFRCFSACNTILTMYAYDIGHSACSNAPIVSASTDKRFSAETKELQSATSANPYHEH
jgi:hypothetical protein